MRGHSTLAQANANRKALGAGCMKPSLNLLRGRTSISFIKYWNVLQYALAVIIVPLAMKSV